MKEGGIERQSSEHSERQRRELQEYVDWFIPEGWVEPIRKVREYYFPTDTADKIFWAAANNELESSIAQLTPDVQAAVRAYFAEKR